MRWAQYKAQGAERIGAAHEDVLVDIVAATEAMTGISTPLASVGLALARGEAGREQARAAVDWAVARMDPQENSMVSKLEAVEFLPAITSSTVIFCVGFNYAAHGAEAGVSASQYPELFMRTPASLVGHGASIVRPAVSEMLDFEGELAVVIGSTCHRVGQDDALRFVGGYACFNDGSVRDFQKHTSVPTAGKNFVYSGAMGPFVVSADEIAEPQELRLTTRVSSEVMQSAPTSDMIFGVREIVSYISQFTILRPGDVIATGTPAGIGFRRTPPRYLQPGNVVTVEISGVGTLVNPVTDE